MQKKNILTDVRLGSEVTPIRYDIEIKPDLENFTFGGVETILISIKNPTKILTLHSKEIKITTASIIFSNKLKQFTKNYLYNKEAETVSFEFEKPIPVGKTKLTLVFEGILNDKMRGFYKSSYNIGDKVYNIATTQFEATDARRAFPCFDEPAHKAVFNVSLIVPKGKTAISNTLPISREEHEAGYEIVKFSPTPKMSTYLLAFIVGDFEYIEKKSKRGVIVRIYTTHGKIHQAKFALDVTVRVLEFYEKYFDIPYPIQTLDMIALPDFASGAMENWGAVTFREVALLVDEEHSSASNRQWVALVIAHELAHQWFGNLVTMEWWTHLWLNEGFASYIEYLAVDKLFPKWDIWTQFSTNDLGVALRLDSLLNTHPIEIPVHHPSEIGEIFDEVSYSKGASIIRMLASYLGEKNFRDGLRYYLKKHSYKNTETIHLWQAFQKISRKPVASMMHTWTSKPGYPIVYASIDNKNKLRLIQERFFSSPVSKKKVKDNTTWIIPEKNLITKEYIKVNFGEESFYRTAYSSDMLERLKKPVQEKKISARDRLGIIRDLFATSEAGIISTTLALEFISAFKNEDDYTVWFEITSGLARIEQLLGKDQKMRALLDKLIISLFSPIIKRLGVSVRSGESHTDTLLRSLALARLGRSGDKKTIALAKSVWKAMEQGEQIHPDIRGSLYSTLASSGDMREYEGLIARYNKENLHEEKNRIGNALGNFQDPKILKLACDFAMSKSVRIQDTVGIISSVGANPMGRDIWIGFIKKHWQTLVTRYGDGGMALARLVKAIGGSAEKKHFSDFKKFFKVNDAPGAARAVEQVQERLESNILCRERDYKNIAKFLRSQP